MRFSWPIFSCKFFEGGYAMLIGSLIARMLIWSHGRTSLLDAASAMQRSTRPGPSSLAVARVQVAVFLSPSADTSASW